MTLLKNINDSHLCDYYWWLISIYQILYHQHVSDTINVILVLTPSQVCCMISLSLPKDLHTQPRSGKVSEGYEK